MRDHQLTFGDLERAARDRDPQLGDLLVRYLAQDDPPDGLPEPGTEAARALEAAAEDKRRAAGEDDDDDDDDLEEPEVPSGAPTRDWLIQQVSDRAMRGKTATERKLARREAWAAVVASRWAPPRFGLGKLLVDLYEAGDLPARAALRQVFGEGMLGWGAWQGVKAIYKLTETRHDAEMFGVLACRFDVMVDTRYRKDELGLGTIIYLRRRAWRWLRLLGRAVPAAYPHVAVEVLRNYGARTAYQSSWVAAHIWGWKQLVGAKGGLFRPPESLEVRAFPDAWKLSPAPVLRLLIEAGNDLVCEFAIRSLRGDHAAALRTIEPAWLARLGRRPPLAPVHRFLVDVLRERPDLHMTRLRDAGLHEVVLGLLMSPETTARAYAIEYARAHAPDLDVATLIELAAGGASEVAAFAADRLGTLTPAAIGLANLVRLVGAPATHDLAIAKLKQGFRPTDLDAALFTVLAIGTVPQRTFVSAWFSDANLIIPAAHWMAVLAHADCPWQVRTTALTELGKRRGAEIGAAWLMKALDDPQLTAAVGQWLDNGLLAGDALDVEWVKGLVAKPRLRPLALKLLGNRALIAPARIGLGWLLEQARSADAELHGFAHRLLLEHFAPEDFAAGGSGDRAAGIDRVWALAAGDGSPEPVRAFAATYLKAHHPDLGPQLAEAKALGLTPRLGHDDYPAARVVPLLDDPRADVRRLAAAITAEELVRWDTRGLVYRLAASVHREPRTLGCELLLGAAGVGEARLPADWLDGPRLFALAESGHKATRETALTIIRRAYDRVGGAARLAWLMESAERDVRLFAVRLFWDRHRPRATPPGWKPPKDVGAPSAGDPLPAGDDEIAALRQFLRTVLFGLPPGRLEKRDPVGADGAKRAMPERPLAASVAKRRLIEAVRDLGKDEVGFAAVMAPVLGEFAASAARGEWQACASALASLRARHPGLGLLGLPASRSLDGAAHRPKPVARGGGSR